MLGNASMACSGFSTVHWYHLQKKTPCKFLFSHKKIKLGLYILARNVKDLGKPDSISVRAS